MIKIDLIEKVKELYTYINVDIDKEFAIELIPVVELVMTTPDMMKKLAKCELNIVQRLYIRYCEKNNIKSKTYMDLMDHMYNSVRFKVYKLLEALYDIVQEDSPAWNTRWKIKSCYKIKFDEVKTNIGVMLEPKPEYVEKEKRNEEIRKYNMKQHKKCQKWRDSNLKFYKKMLKIISN